MLRGRGCYVNDVNGGVGDHVDIRIVTVRAGAIEVLGNQIGEGIGTRPTASVALEVDGEQCDGVAGGDGAVDATFNAISALFPHEARLQLYQVHAVTEGTDAQAEVTVRLEENGKTVNGQGADTDTLVASCRAYVHALNKLLTKRQKTAPEALSA